MLRQKELTGGGTGRQAAQIQRAYDSDIGRGEAYAGGTGDFYRQEQGFDRKLPSAGESPYRQQTQSLENRKTYGKNLQAEAAERVKISAQKYKIEQRGKRQT